MKASRSHRHPCVLMPLTTICTLLASLLAGCGSVDPQALDYRSIVTAPVAPALRLAQPPGQNSSGADQPQGVSSQPQQVLPTVPGMSIERDGSVSWLKVTDQTPEQLWPKLRAFWHQQGFALIADQEKRRVMETDWRETYARVDRDIFHHVFSKALGNNAYVAGVRNKFRLRIEPGAQGGYAIFIAQQGMREVPAGLRGNISQWQATPNDPGMETEYLQRLMYALAGSPATKAVASNSRAGLNAAAPSQPTQIVPMPPPAVTPPATTAAPSTATVSNPVGMTQPEQRNVATNDPSLQQLMLGLDYDDAWGVVGQALAQANFTLDRSDKEHGIYTIRYVDPRPPAVPTGFWRRLFHRTPPKTAQLYRINVKALTQNSARVAIVDDHGQLQTTPQAQHILQLLDEQLRNGQGN